MVFSCCHLMYGFGEHIVLEKFAIFPFLESVVAFNFFTLFVL